MDLLNVGRRNPFFTTVEDQLQRAKKKAVSAFGLRQRLTTFSELFEEATPEEKRELLRQDIDQLIYRPDRIRIAFQGPVVEPATKVSCNVSIGDPEGTRTPVAGVKGRCPNH